MWKISLTEEAWANKVGAPSVFNATLFARGDRWNQPKYPSLDGCVKEMCCTGKIGCC